MWNRQVALGVLWRAACVVVLLAMMEGLGGSSGLLAQGPGAGRAPMRVYRTMYYDLHTDIDEAMVVETAYRMTAMGAEYSRRLQDFRGKVSRRLPFYLFSRAEDYLAAGGMAGSAGVYMWDSRTGGKLMAVMGKSRGERMWHVIQHEGFHQFVSTAMRRGLPPWVNEGLAEYFGEGTWTGDGFVVGLVPRGRLRRIKGQIKGGKMDDLAALLNMDSKTWSEKIDYRNYDHAWLLVHFLIHGQGGKYHVAFADFLSDLGAGRPWEKSFVNRFGGDVRQMQKECNAWWQALPDDATPELSAQVVAQTLTSFLARATARKQEFKDFEDFRGKAGEGKVQISSAQYLPPKLLSDALKGSRRYKSWEIKRIRIYPALVLTDEKGNVYTGTFRVRNGQAANVALKFTPAPKAKPKASGLKKARR